MNQELQEQLKQIYSAPQPEHKREFIRNHSSRKISLWHMLGIQLAYISKKVWVISALLLAGVVFMSKTWEPRMLGFALALMPLLVLISVSESVRSIIYGMDELEMAARFSLKSIVMAKLGILGVENLVILMLAAVFIRGQFLPSTLYLLTPYLVTALGNLMLVRRIRGVEATYACTALAALVSLAQIYGTFTYQWLYETRYVGIWGIAVVILFCMVIRETFQTIHITEDLAWN